MFPLEFDEVLYRALNPDLVQLSSQELVIHYFNHGCLEGRRASVVGSRETFFSLIPPSASVLEIGPFNNPAVRSERTSYFDTLSTEDLRARAESLGIDGSSVPEITWASAHGDLSIVGETFDYCVSSHVVEHQPDLIGHLDAVCNCLRSGGRYLLAVPDRRFTFDYFLPETVVADVLEAHLERRCRHTLKSVIDHRAMTTHNEVQLHWEGQHGKPSRDTALVERAIREFDDSTSYLDVHAWVFSPASFVEVIETLADVGLITLHLERLYPTLRYSNEFYAVLTKP